MSDNTMPRPLFWLHVKKSAGGTVRRLLGPHYLQAERLRKPVNFIQSDPAAWNDILNNFRIPLGEYQFRRCLFARRYLYPDSWEARLRFAFARHPVERAVSAFFYLRVPRGGQNSFVHHARKLRLPVPEEDGGLFDLFLDLVEEARASDTIYAPVDLHFTTHTAAMWDDVTDEAGKLLLSHVYRVESLHPALCELFELAGIGDGPPEVAPRVNARKPELSYQPTRAQKARIEALYSRDFDLYETALAP